MYRYDNYDHTLVNERVEQFRDQVNRRVGQRRHPTDDDQRRSRDVALPHQPAQAGQPAVERLLVRQRDGTGRGGDAGDRVRAGASDRGLEG